MASPDEPGSPSGSAQSASNTSPARAARSATAAGWQARPATAAVGTCVTAAKGVLLRLLGPCLRQVGVAILWGQPVSAVAAGCLHARLLAVNDVPVRLGVPHAGLQLDAQLMLLHSGVVSRAWG